MNKTLTKAEEQIMQVVWQLNTCSVSEVIAQLPEPKPAYNTVSTIIRILETKKFIGHKQKGRGYLYFPIIPKDVYTQQSAKKLVDNYFEGSFKSMVSFFLKKNDIDLEDLEDLLQQLNKK